MAAFFFAVGARASAAPLTPAGGAPRPDAAGATGAPDDAAAPSTERDGDESEGAGLVGGATGAAVGAYAGTLLGVGGAAGVIAAALALGGAPVASESAPPLLVASLFPATICLLATPGVTAAMGALVGAFFDIESFTTVQSGVHVGARPVLTYLGTLAGMLVCSLPSWWVCGTPIVLALLVVGTEFTLPILIVGGTAFALLLGVGAAAGAAGANAATGAGLNLLFEQLGPRRSDGDGAGKARPQAY